MYFNRGLAQRGWRNSRGCLIVSASKGSGKTCTAMYRLLKFTGARRILSLLDTRNLGEQAEQEMMSYTRSRDYRKRGGGAGVFSRDCRGVGLNAKRGKALGEITSSNITMHTQ
ncbi:DEAD/DEAH box helicase family protein [Methylomonas sp. 11b]|uniref:DEAD/DEAH box helicase family protein n=1 Tax=Methylomonas sp. 11b TaxID=1168169 RepID=UPI000478DDC0|nr:DEAD/DEAH box helicase family protein [Methylomonas sp. 11b]